VGTADPIESLCVRAASAVIDLLNGPDRERLALCVAPRCGQPSSTGSYSDSNNSPATPNRSIRIGSRSPHPTVRGESRFSRSTHFRPQRGRTANTPRCCTWTSASTLSRNSTKSIRVQWVWELHCFGICTTTRWSRSESMPTRPAIHSASSWGDEPSAHLRPSHEFTPATGGVDYNEGRKYRCHPDDQLPGFGYPTPIGVGFPKLRSRFPDRTAGHRVVWLSTAQGTQPLHRRRHSAQLHCCRSAVTEDSLALECRAQ